MTLKGGKTGSIKALKDQTKRGDGGAFLKRISADGVVVRFMEEPTEWYRYLEHFDPETNTSYPCQEDECPGCANLERKPTTRFLANAVDVNESRVVPIILPKSVAQELVRYYEKYNTLTDRDYELSREGSGLDTVYHADPESPHKFNLGKYESLDLESLLNSQLEDGEDDDEDDEDEVETPATRAVSSSRRSRGPRPPFRPSPSSAWQALVRKPTKAVANSLTGTKPVKKIIKK